MIWLLRPSPLDHRFTHNYHRDTSRIVADLLTILRELAKTTWNTGGRTPQPRVFPLDDSGGLLPL
jgi:hypothetical protein